MAEGSLYSIVEHIVSGVLWGGRLEKWWVALVASDRIA